MKKTLAILDTSMNVTGAYLSGMALAEALSDDFNILYYVPVGSALISKCKNSKVKILTYNYLGVRKKLYNILAFLPMAIFNAVLLKKNLFKNSVDIVIVNDYINVTGGFLKIIRWKGKLFTYVRLIPSSLPRSLNHFYFYIMQMFSDGNIAVSNAVYDELKIKTKIKSIRIYDCIYNISNTTKVDTELYREISKEINFKGINYIYIGNYMPGKGQLEALTAFCKTISDDNYSTLTFYGGDLGLKKNNDFKMLLINMVINLGLSNRIFIKKFIDVNALFFSYYDVLLNFSKSESFSRTCLEASHAKLAVIATKCGGPQEIIIDMETGILVDIDNVDQMAEAMLYFTHNPLDCKRFGDLGKNYVDEKFSFIKYKYNIKKYIKQVL